MNELNKRMFAIENLLSRLEEKMGPADEVSPPTTSSQVLLTTHHLTSTRSRFRRFFLFCVCMQSPMGQNEEEKLRRKLSELAGNLSDKAISSEDETGGGGFSSGVVPTKGAVATALDSLKDKELSSSSDEMPTQAQKV